MKQVHDLILEKSTIKLNQTFIYEYNHTRPKFYVTLPMSLESVKFSNIHNMGNLGCVQKCFSTFGNFHQKLKIYQKQFKPNKSISLFYNFFLQLNQYNTRYIYRQFIYRASTSSLYVSTVSTMILNVDKNKSTLTLQPIFVSFVVVVHQ